MQLFPEYKTALFTLSREELLSNGFQKGDTDAFVNYGLNLKGYVFSVFMAEDTQKDFVKISFRSKEDFDVSELARTHFSGGGHINAAGGRSELSLEETVKKFIDLLPNYAENSKILWLSLIALGACTHNPPQYPSQYKKADLWNILSNLIVI